MKDQNYAAAHATLRVSAKRFEPSPYADKYANDDTVFGIYCRRFYPLSVGDDPIEQYWEQRRGVRLFDVPEKPLDIKGPATYAVVQSR